MIMLDGSRIQHLFNHPLLYILLYTWVSIRQGLTRLDPFFRGILWSWLRGGGKLLGSSNTYWYFACRTSKVVFSITQGCNVVDIGCPSWSWSSIRHRVYRLISETNIVLHNKPLSCSNLTVSTDTGSSLLINIYWPCRINAIHFSS